VQPSTIHGIAHLIALPWSWLFGDGVGVPTLEQVAGTRINLKDPLFLLSAEHLRSWRWFLVLSVFTYGLVPRLVLLATVHAETAPDAGRAALYASAYPGALRAHDHTQPRDRRRQRCRPGDADSGAAEAADHGASRATI
jgi:hypothetical protein